MKLNVIYVTLLMTLSFSPIAKGGEDIYDLQQILGHADLQMTKRYAHLSPDHLRTAINIVSFGKQSGVDPQSVHKAKLSMIK